MSNQSNFSLPFINTSQEDIVFQSPWHSQLFAITVQLSEQGNFLWTEFAEIFGESLNQARLKIKSLDGNDNYFNCWLNALEKIIVDKNMGSLENLSLLKENWTKAYLATPHGQPVKI
jgi:nitrile hydratase accessory protein